MMFVELVKKEFKREDEYKIAFYIFLI